jgi:VWFA-related protein
MTSVKNTRKLRQTKPLANPHKCITIQVFMKARLLLCPALLLLSLQAFAQPEQPSPPKQKVRTVTVPISIFTKKELKERRTEEYVQVETITVKEDNEQQAILSIRSVADTPLSIAILVQEDLSTGFNNQLNDIRNFIRSLPQGTRIMVAYLGLGSPRTLQRWTEDREAAAKSLRIVISSSAAAPSSPYEGLNAILPRFDGVPAGRRAVLLFSDGLDISGGLNLASIAQSFDLEQAILKAQKRSIAIYSFCWPTERSKGNSTLGFAAQAALQKLSDQTGGRAFGNGISEFPSFGPYFSELEMTLSRQFALSYISTHMKKGFHTVNITSSSPDVKIEHPAGYYYR